MKRQQKLSIVIFVLGTSHLQPEPNSNPVSFQKNLAFGPFRHFRNGCWPLWVLVKFQTLRFSSIFGHSFVPCPPSLVFAMHHCWWPRKSLQMATTAGFHKFLAFFSNDRTPVRAVRTVSATDDKNTHMHETRLVPETRVAESATWLESGWRSNDF